MVNFILGSESVSVVILLIVFFGTVFETHTKPIKKRLFISLISISLISVISDFISWLPLNWNKCYFLAVSLTTFSFVFPMVFILFFTLYLYVHISDRVDIKKIYFKISIIYSMVVVLLSLVLCIDGKIFTIVNGDYKVADLYVFYVISGLVSVFYLLFIVLANAKKIGVHDTLTTVLFFVIPFCGILLNLIYPELELTISAVSLDVLFAYVMLQSDQQKYLIKKEKKALDQAHLDELTGLKNRLAYSIVLDKQTDEPVSVLFCDVNGLKYTNDHFGHKAGDKLLVDFSNDLKELFGEEYLFRISGDEFVVLKFGNDYKQFEQLASKLSETKSDIEMPKASFGMAFGNSKQLSLLVDIAEREMYQKKNEIHKLFPMYSRSN